MGVVTPFPIVDRTVRKLQVVSSERFGHHKGSFFIRGKEFIGVEPGPGVAYSVYYAGGQFLVKSVVPVPARDPRALELTLEMLSNGGYRAGGPVFYFVLENGEYPPDIDIRGSMEPVEHYEWVRPASQKPAS